MITVLQSVASIFCFFAKGKAGKPEVGSAKKLAGEKIIEGFWEVQLQTCPQIRLGEVRYLWPEREVFIATAGSWRECGNAHKWLNNGMIRAHRRGSGGIVRGSIASYTHIIGLHKIYRLQSLLQFGCQGCCLVQRNSTRAQRHAIRLHHGYVIVTLYRSVLGSAKGFFHMDSAW